MRLLAAALVLSFALAGCGSKDASDVSDGPTAAPPGFAISGVVVTPTVQAIPGATVLLTPGDLEKTTDLFGRFRFTDLEAGTYRLKATADGHEGAQATITVTADAIARPKLTLAPILPPQVRHETLTFQGQIKSSFGPADEASEPYKETIGMDGCDCIFPISLPRYTVAMTVEVFWEDQFGLEGVIVPEYRWSLTPHSLSHVASGQAPAPILATVTPGDFVGDGAFRFEGVNWINLRVAADENIPTTDQEFQVFVTVWEVEQPPAGWSFIRGDR